VHAQLGTASLRNYIEIRIRSRLSSQGLTLGGILKLPRVLALGHVDEANHLKENDTDGQCSDVGAVLLRMPVKSQIVDEWSHCRHL